MVCCSAYIRGNDTANSTTYTLPYVSKYEQIININIHPKL